jgi:SAM-dependent methyltransferase
MGKLHLETPAVLYKRIVSEVAKGKCLEIGCGIGYAISHAAEMIPGQTHVAIDIKDYRVFKPKNVRFIKTSLNKMKVNGKFDTIIMFHVLEHMKDSVGVIEKLHGMLNKGGKLIVAVPNRTGFMNMSQLTSCEEYSPHLWLFDHEMVEFLLSKLNYNFRFLPTYCHLPFSGKIGRLGNRFYNLMAKLEQLVAKSLPRKFWTDLLFIIDK